MTRGQAVGKQKISKVPKTPEQVVAKWVALMEHRMEKDPLLLRCEKLVAKL